ncbi:glycosyl hydrolase family 95 catalytic domain-containing protein [Kribbella italica]|uniref:Alpha-L-fucosidase 2 n=1 Tax=Kribbella italica TaxID=1540520 RepID=A0A7W9MTD0_9ACTN|nr:glycoside hydrolase N-terminal domain-containing protein [Kribbella italica]MBB5835666.1 alpha-L-fucosidase 2 [Kribbella italica]
MTTSGQSSDPVRPLLDRRRFLQAAGMIGLAAGLPAFAPHPAVARPAGDRPVPDSQALRMWYRTPAAEAKMIEEGLPLGNGRLGALIGGGPDDTALFVTDATAWTGGVNSTLDAAGQFPYNAEEFGSFQLLTKARVRLDGHTPAAVEDYRRRLDLSNGVVVTTYRWNGVTYRQEAFSSHPDDVIVLRLTSSAPAAITGAVTLEGTRDESVTAVAREQRVELVDDLGNGLRYAATAGVATVGGQAGANGTAVTFTGAEEVVVVISGGTNYRPDSSIGYRDSALDVAGLARRKLRDALDVRGERLLATHGADYRRAFDTFSLDLGASTDQQRALDTAARLAARDVPEPAPDPEFEALYLQYARYLTITGSRGGLPTNLQGLWLEGNNPAWFSDYHNDINLQMNYWPTHRFGLAGFAEPLLNYCLAQLPEWSKQTRELFNDPRNRFRNSSGRIAGWTVAISTNIFGGNGWWWHPAGNAWLCLELWQHYEHTMDRQHVRRMMPLLRGAVEFWETRLIETTLGDGTTVLVADKGWSPEHGPQDGIGTTYDQELVHALFGHFVEAARLLQTDGELASRAQAMRDRLYLPEVSPTTGWLQEWMSPDNLGDAQHRHLSGLVGWYPGDRIRFDNQPAEYVEGVRKQLEVRGFESFGWAVAWRAACWARLKDSNRAHLCISGVLRQPNGRLGGSAINLFDVYKTDGYIFQIDANYGVAAAILEMLVHAKPGVIDLLPAVPAVWKDGSVKGMGVRGGFTLDMTWKNGRPATVTLHSTGGTRTELRVGDWRKTITLRPGRSVTVRPQGTPYPPPPAPASRTKAVNAHSGLAREVDGGS